MLHLSEKAPLVFFAIFSVTASIMGALAAKDVYIVHHGVKNQGVVEYTGEVERDHARHNHDLKGAGRIKPGVRLLDRDGVTYLMRLRYVDVDGTVRTTPYECSFDRKDGESISFYHIPHTDGFILDADTKEILMPFLWLLLISSASYAGAFGLAFYNKSLREEGEAR